jgi:hypothetical protein
MDDVTKLLNKITDVLKQKNDEIRLWKSRYDKMITMFATTCNELKAARMDNRCGAEALRRASAKMVRAKLAGLAIWESCSKILPQHKIDEIERIHTSDFAALELLTDSALDAENEIGMARRDGRPPCQDGLSPSPSPPCCGSSESPNDPEK